MPKQVSVRPADWAARRKAVATRLTTLRVRESSTLPPLILFAGHRPSQEQKALALRHLLMSTPISETMSSTLATLRPTTRVRSTPQMRCSNPAISILGSLALALRFFLVLKRQPADRLARCQRAADCGVRLRPAGSRFRRD